MGSSGLKSAHHNLFVAEVSLQSRAVPTRAKWAVL